MTDNNLKHLSRLELLELLLEQGRQLEAANEKNLLLEEENAALKSKLESREILLAEAGSIAKASLQMNGVFEAAQKAADQYLENIQRLEREATAKYDVSDTLYASSSTQPENTYKNVNRKSPARKLLDLVQIGRSLRK